MRNGTDIAGAHGEHKIVGAQQALQGLCEALDTRHKHRLSLTATTHCATNRSAVCTCDGCFACGVNLAHEQHVSGRKYGREVIEQVTRARIAMRLKCEHHASTRIRLTDRLERRADLGRVMTVSLMTTALPVPAASSPTNCSRRSTP